MDTNEKEGCRHTQWFAIMSFTIIALAALITNFDNDTNVSDQTSKVKWVVSAISIALSLASISVLANLFIPEKFQKTSLETGMATLTVAFWIAALPVIMDPEHNLAVDSYLGGVSNLNLYFFSWAAFLVSFLNFVHCASHTICTMWNNDGTTTNDTAVTDHRCSRSLWAGAVVMSFVVMIASSRIYDDTNCADLDVVSDTLDAICDRTKFGISLGAISAVLGIIWTVISMFWVKGSTGSIIEFGLVLFLTMMWTVGVVLLTFDKNKSPGRELGNLYFFSWGGWSLCVFLLMSSFLYFLSRNEVTETGYGENDEGDKDKMKNKPTMEQVNEEEQVTTDDVMDA